MRSAWGQRLGEEALLAVLAHGFDTLSLPIIVAGHGVAHDILWGSKKIEVCMWEITAEIRRITNRQL